VARKKLLLIWAKGGFTSVVKRNQSFFCFFFVHKKDDTFALLFSPVHPGVVMNRRQWHEGKAEEGSTHE
jgi:hypothetical protein